MLTPQEKAKLKDAAIAIAKEMILEFCKYSTSLQEQFRAMKVTPTVRAVVQLMDDPQFTLTYHAAHAIASVFDIDYNNEIERPVHDEVLAMAKESGADVSHAAGILSGLTPGSDEVN